MQAATGFGFALLAAPVAFAALDAAGGDRPAAAARHRDRRPDARHGRARPQPLVRRSAIVLALGGPAAVAGVAVLRALDAVTLQVAVSVGVPRR